MKKWIIIMIASITIFAVGCSTDKEAKQDANGNDLKEVSFVLDWTPNTNHTGLYVAMEKGYYEDAGIELEMILPGEVQAEQLLATRKADFGTSFQTELTQAKAEGLDVVSIAAIIQHNTSGYASPADKGIDTPIDFEGKTYGAYGSAIEEAKLAAIMESEQGNVKEVSTIILRETDFFAAVERDVDFASIFYGWTGIEAEIRGEELTMIYDSDYVDELDSYEPLIATSRKLIDEDPELVRAFTEATAKGYEFAIDEPEQAAQILIDHEPDLDPELVKRSQEWLADKYQYDASQWGIQKQVRWDGYLTFLLDYDILTEEVDMSTIFTNEFLPNQ